MKKATQWAAPSSCEIGLSQNEAFSAENQSLSRVSAPTAGAVTGESALLCPQGHCCLSHEAACPLCVMADEFDQSHTEGRSHEV